MKLRHHVPLNARSSSDPVSRDYQAEVDRATDRAQREYEAAQRRLAKAELRLTVARSKAVSRAANGRSQRELAVALELVELRREELLKLDALMKGAPSSLTHRGRGHYRPVPQQASVV